MGFKSQMPFFSYYFTYQTWLGYLSLKWTGNGIINIVITIIIVFILMFHSWVQAVSSNPQKRHFYSSSSVASECLAEQDPFLQSLDISSFVFQHSISSGRLYVILKEFLYRWETNRPLSFNPICLLSISLLLKMISAPPTPTPTPPLCFWRAEILNTVSDCNQHHAEMNWPSVPHIL